MPLVVADIVDPTSTLAPSCTALLPLLEEADAALGSSADDERPDEPLREPVTTRCLEVRAPSTAPSNLLPLCHASTR